MSFHCYQFRSNRNQLTTCLRRHIDNREWSGLPRGGRPSANHVSRMQAFLAAWSGAISDRYLDSERLMRFNPGLFRSYEHFKETVGRNSRDGGAVSFVRQELEDNGLRAVMIAQPEAYGARPGFYHPFFGSELLPYSTVDMFINALYEWEDRHCFAIVPFAARVTGGGAPADWRASYARDFIKWWQEHRNPSTIYLSWNINWT